MRDRWFWCLLVEKIRNEIEQSLDAYFEVKEKKESLQCTQLLQIIGRKKFLALIIEVPSFFFYFYLFFYFLFFILTFFKDFKYLLCFLRTSSVFFFLFLACFNMYFCFFREYSYNAVLCVSTCKFTVDVFLRNSILFTFMIYAIPCNYCN